jgi:hypothetical protein
MEQMIFVPSTGQFFLQEDEGPLDGLKSVVAERLMEMGWPCRVHLLGPGLPAETADGVLVELLDALPLLCGLPVGEIAPPSILAWAGAARAALQLIAEGRLAPRLRSQKTREDDERIAGWEARWAVVLGTPVEQALLQQLVANLGAQRVAVPLSRRARADQAVLACGYTTKGLVRRFLDVCADTLVREASRRGASVRLGGWPADAWEQRLVRALTDDRAGFAAGEPDPASLAQELRAWADDQALSPSLLPSPPSWQAHESLREALSRMTGPAGLLARRLLNGEPAPRTLVPSVALPAARLSQAIAVTRTLMRLTGQQAATPARKEKAG